MREIKFRAWNVRRFLKEDEVAILPSGKLIFLVKDGESESEYREMEFLDVKVSFFTGLKDKNGKEIYESDFVKGEHRAHEDWSPIQKVTYFNGCYMFGNWNAQEYFNKHTKIEVIGNIYEHPHLLEATT